MKTRTVKIIVDVLLFVILILELVPTEIVPVQIHFIAGLIFAGLIIIHILLNRKWCVSVTKALMARKINKKVKCQYVTDWFLLITWILVTLSGIPAMGFAMGEAEELVIFRNIHIAFAILGMLLIIIHLLQHKNQIRAYIKTKNGGNRK